MLIRLTAELQAHFLRLLHEVSSRIIIRQCGRNLSGERIKLILVLCRLTYGVFTLLRQQTILRIGHQFIGFLAQL